MTIEPSQSKFETQLASRTIGDVIAAHAAEFPDNAAIVCNGASCSFRELDAKIREVGERLRDAGLDASSRIAILLPSGPEAALLTVAIAANATAVPLHPKLTHREIEHEIDRFDVDAVVVPAWQERLSQSVKRIGRIGVWTTPSLAGSFDSASLDEYTAGLPARVRQISANPGAAVLVRSPLTVDGIHSISHGDFLATAEGMKTRLGLGPGDRCGSVLPFHRPLGFWILLISPLLTGGSIAIADGRIAPDLASWVGDLKPTWLSATPGFLADMLDRLRSNGPQRHGLRFIESCGGALSEAVRAELEATLGIPVREVDLADADDFLTTAERSPDVIIRGGEPIFADDVEQALKAHPAVEDVAAIGKPHPRLEQGVAAAVVLKAGASATPAALTDFLAGRIAQFKIPGPIAILDALPRDSKGRISKQQLRREIFGGASPAAAPDETLEFQILDIWRKWLKRDDIGVEDNFFEAGGDSLLATNMLLEVEALTRQSIPQSSLREAYTVRQLAIVVARAEPARDESITCAREGTGVPFFYCHGDWWSRGLYALKLADLLALETPVYLLHTATHISKNSRIDLKQLAGIYVDQILATYPRGPVRLGGFCFGGLVVWEVAHQLKRTGRQVEFVALIDAISINARRSARTADAVIAACCWLLPRGVGAKLRRRGMCLVWAWLEWLHVPDKRSFGLRSRIVSTFTGKYQEKSTDYMPEIANMDAVYSPMLWNYVPPPMESPIIAIVCETSRATYKFSPIPWQRLAKDVRIETVPGEHLSCITTHVATLAEVMRKCFAGKP